MSRITAIKNVTKSLKMALEWVYNTIRKNKSTNRRI